MIKSFKSAEMQEFYESRSSRRWASIESVALRKLDQIEAAVNLSDLHVPPGNRLELLKGGRAGQHSIRVNDQFRICFTWRDGGAHDVEITDYH